MTQYVAVKSPKSVGLGILLALLFGPIGLFYSSVSGGLIMTFGPIILLVMLFFGIFTDNPLLFGVSIILILGFAFTWWLICMIWAVIGVNRYNRELDREDERQNDLYSIQSSKPQVIPSQNNLQETTQYSQRQSSDNNLKPSISEWSRNNPGKSINDYFAKYRD